MTTEPSSELRAAVEAVAERCGCELLELRFGGGILRLTLDREGGVTLADCENVSREVSAILDLEDFGASRYTLEVSSPGLDRPLYGPRDYRRFAGRDVKVTWRDVSNSRKQTSIGELLGLEDGDGEPSVARFRIGDQVVSLALDDILEARLEPQF